MPGIVGDSNGETIKASRGKLSTTVKYKAYSSSTYDPSLGSKVLSFLCCAYVVPLVHLLTSSQLHQDCQIRS